MSLDSTLPEPSSTGGNNPIQIRTRSHVCKTCHITLLSKRGLVAHETSHINQDTIFFGTKNNCASTHVQNGFTRLTTGIRKKRTYRCKFCDKLFTRLFNLNRHESAIHQGINRDLTGICNEHTYHCRFCDKLFPRLYNRNRHESRIHKENLVKLQNQMKAKRDTVSCVLKKKEQYVCTGCYKWFSTQKEFMLHAARVHKVQNPSSLQLIIMIDEKVYSCKGCQKVFTDDKEICEQCVYRCRFCNKRFSQLSSCKKHESNAHKNKISQMVTESKDKEPENVGGFYILYTGTGTTKEEVLNCNFLLQETYILPTPYKSLLSEENPLTFKSEHLLSDNIQIKDESPDQECTTSCPETTVQSLLSEENSLTFKSEHLLSDNVQIKDELPDQECTISCPETNVQVKTEWFLEHDLLFQN